MWCGGVPIGWQASCTDKVGTKCVHTAPHARPAVCLPSFPPPQLLDWADKALGQGISTMTRGVKNLLSGARQAPVAAALEALVEGKPVGPARGPCMHSEGLAPAARSG